MASLCWFNYIARYVLTSLCHLVLCTVNWWLSCCQWEAIALSGDNRLVTASKLFTGACACVAVHHQPRHTCYATYSQAITAQGCRLRIDRYAHCRPSSLAVGWTQNAGGCDAHDYQRQHGISKLVRWQEPKQRFSMVYFKARAVARAKTKVPWSADIERLTTTVNGGENSRHSGASRHSEPSHPVVSGSSRSFVDEEIRNKRSLP